MKERRYTGEYKTVTKPAEEEKPYTKQETIAFYSVWVILILFFLFVIIDQIVRGLK